MLGVHSRPEDFPSHGSLDKGYGMTLKEAGSRLPGAKMMGQCAVQGPQLFICLSYYSFCLSQRMFNPQIPLPGALDYTTSPTLPTFCPCPLCSQSHIPEHPLHVCTPPQHPLLQGQPTPTHSVTPTCPSSQTSVLPGNLVFWWP